MDWNAFVQNEPKDELEGFEMELPRGRRVRPPITSTRIRPATRFQFRRFQPIRFPIWPWSTVTLVGDRVTNEPRPKPDKPTPEPNQSNTGTSSNGTTPTTGDAAAQGNEYIRWVQSTLNHALGMQLPLSGLLDTETRSAIRSFQQQKGLPADGIIGPDTEQALKAARSAGSSGKSNEFETFNFQGLDQEWESEISRTSREYIKWVQQSLNQIMGLRLAVDGMSGTQTRSAIRSFQQQHGLSADGIVGPQTERTLVTAGASKPPDGTNASSGFPSGGMTLPSVPIGQASGMPPIEGPYKGIRGIRCANGVGKCWKSHVRDIIDTDAPWNNSSNRNAANYAAVLDYLNVENPDNYRYASVTSPTGKRSTYCNIYGHDATRMMGASIPHWILDQKQPNGWNELSANGTFDWMRSNSRAIGWVQIDIAMCQWIKEQLDRRQSIPYSNGSVPEQILIAGARIAASNHADPTLLLQPSYVAQQFANLGLPAVMLWKNPNKNASGRPLPGHVAMVRPEDSALQGQRDRKTGIYVPRSAQAGGKNFRNALALWITGRSQRSHPVLFYVHA